MNLAARAGWLAVLALLAVAVRLPYWFDAVVGWRELAGWDESTFIIVAQAVLDGEVLYSGPIGLKPPMVFYAFAGVLALFGEHIAAVRAFGTAVVFVAAAMTFLIAERCAGRVAAVVAGMLCVLALSLTGEAQALLSEHLAVTPLLAALVLLGRERPAPAAFGLAGLLLGMAVLARLNLAYVVLVMVPMVALHPGPSGIGARLRTLTWFGAGGIAILIATMLPNLVAGAFDDWWAVVVEAPLAYSTGQFSPLDAVPELLKPLFLYGNRDTFLHLVLAAGAIPGLVLLPPAARRHGVSRWYVALLGLVLAAVLYSIAVSGGGHAHYVLQAWPFAALLAGVSIAWLGRHLRPALAMPLLAVPAACLLLALQPVATQYRTLSARVAETGSAYGGRALAVADCIRGLPMTQPTVFALSDHLVYWLLSAAPPTRYATHPSNLVKPYLIRVLAGPAETMESQIRAVFATRPSVVVKQQELWYVDYYLGDDERPAVERLLADLLADYDRLALIDGTEILLRRDLVAGPLPSCPA